METDAYEVEPWDFSPLSQHILAAAYFMHCCSLTHRNDSSASVEPVLLIQKPGASLALQTYLPREREASVCYVRMYDGMPDQEGNKLQRLSSGFIQRTPHEAQYIS